MSLSTASVRCALQVALLGSITSNLRAINVLFNTDTIKIIFYFFNSPSEEDEEETEIVISEVLSSFPNISVKGKRVVLPSSSPIPEEGLRIFHRKE